MGEVKAGLLGQERRGNAEERKFIFGWEAGAKRTRWRWLGVGWWSLISGGRIHQDMPQEDFKHKTVGEFRMLVSAPSDCVYLLILN